MGKKWHGTVILSISLYILVLGKARKMVVLRMSIPPSQLWKCSLGQNNLSLKKKNIYIYNNNSNKLLWANNFMLVVIHINLSLKFSNFKLILPGFLPNVLDDSQHVAVMYVHFHSVTNGWQCLLLTLCYAELLAFHWFCSKAPTNHLFTHPFVHVRVIFSSLLLSLGMIDLLKI